MGPLMIFLLVGLVACQARWVGRSEPPKETSFIGTATNELATAILQGYIDDDRNIVFSPLGYSTILAILAEGATGETKKQLVTALHLPSDPKLTRTTYRYILERLKYINKYDFNRPELKNFFYIYKNYTINDDYKQILEDFYLTDVRYVERYTNDFSSNVSDDDDKDSLEEANFNTTAKDTNEKLISYAIEDKPDKVDITNIEEKPAKNIKEKIKIIKTQTGTKESETEEETMVADEAKHHISETLLREKNDVVSSVSVNSVGHKSSKSTQALILIFNGMYFRGSWKKHFELVEPGLFYKSNTQKKQVQMMKTRGIFKTSSLPDLDSNVIQLPYDGDRYALMVIVPRARDGLVRLIADLPSTSLEQIQEGLKEEELLVSLPSFYVDTTTKPVAALAKFGVSSIFGHEAELSGVSSKPGLFVQELVQNVAVRVDNTNITASEIAASNAYEDMEAIGSLKNLPLHEVKEPRRFSVDQPFIFYIVDCLDNVVIVSGKITDPESPKFYEN